MRQEPEVPTLAAWSGGPEKIRACISRFYEHVREDAILAPVFAQMAPQHAAVVASFITEVFGGGPAYTGDGRHSHSTMVAKHLGRQLQEKQRRRWVQLLLETADEVGIPADPEFRSALVAYLEWGSRIAVINSATTENPIDETAPMPKWGWGETKGPYIPK